MLKRAPTLLTAVLCIGGLLACDGQDAPIVEGDTTTIDMNRLQNGDLEYCDAAGNCETFPYNGDCATIQIDINTQTGSTCERCILDDGTVVDQGCTDTSLACVVITLPEPDCVICAYVDGAIVFSTCTVDEPQCGSDLECVDANGLIGTCVNGGCIFEPDPCALVDCAPGFHCETQDVYCVTAPCPPQAICAPDATDCQSDIDCPAGFGCLLACPADATTGNAAPCAPGSAGCGWECFGTCEPVAPDCYSDLDCVRPDGAHGSCFQGQCHYDVGYCWSDFDCAPDEVCEYAPTATDPANGSGFVAQMGVCVPAAPGCTTNDQCALGTGDLGHCINGECVYRFDCDVTHAFCDMIPPTCLPGQSITVVNGCFGECVDSTLCAPSIPDCSTNTLCAPGTECVTVCAPCASTDPTCASTCESICEPIPSACTANSECPPNSECMTLCWDCAAGDPNCMSGCESFCQPTGPECLSDLDCGMAGTVSGSCIGGVCYYDQQACYGNADCPFGQICDNSCTGNTAPGGGGNNTGAPVWCGGVCVDPPPPSDCFPSGCSGQVCSDTDVMTTCEWMPAYACFYNARCERQIDGACGWTDTPELAQCLTDSGSSGGGGTPGSGGNGSGGAP